MARVKRATNAHKKRKVVLERASGYRGQRSRLYRKAKEQVLHSMTYAYRDRKDRKGAFRRLWIQRINAAARANGMTYNRFVQGLRVAGVEVDRRMLAELAVADEAAFSALVEVAKKARWRWRKARLVSRRAAFSRGEWTPSGSSETNEAKGLGIPDVRGRYAAALPAASGSAFLATSTRAEKAASSATASSASIRRSTSTPATRRPCTNRL